MIKLLGLGIFAFTLLAEGQLPSSAVGKWTVGKPYDVGQPVGLDAKQEEAIIGLVIKVSPSQLAVCGRSIPIKSVDVHHLTSSDFLAKYNFTPDLIGFSDGPIVEISLNKLHSTNACGEFADPGTDLLISKGHAVVEVGNGYFRLNRFNPGRPKMRQIPATILCLMAFSSSAHAQTWPLGPCARASTTPILSPNPNATFTDPITGQPVPWEALHTFNPAAIVRNGKVEVLYRAEDNTGPMQIGMHTSRLGLAESSDGIHFTPRPTPVFYPAKDAQQAREWPGGVEDPRIVESEDGTYVLTYTQWNRTTYTVGIATSSDLMHWTKHGPAFDSAAGGKYQRLQYKSAGILTHLVGDRLLAAKIDGKYWMYWGEIQIRLATSRDLIHWTPVEDSHGQPRVLLTARPGLFDSAFPEVGPPPLLTERGIILFYNGKNADPTSENKPAADLSPGAYSGGQALFSASDPTRLLDRPTQPYIHPELPFEKTGQYRAGTIFTEGLVPFHNQWFLYYGAADSYVGVATCDR